MGEFSWCAYGTSKAMINAWGRYALRYFWIYLGQNKKKGKVIYACIRVGAVLIWEDLVLQWLPRLEERECTNVSGLKIFLTINFIVKISGSATLIANETNIILNTKDIKMSHPYTLLLFCRQSPRNF
jgi:hypothetical protein